MYVIFFSRFSSTIPERQFPAPPTHFRWCCFAYCALCRWPKAYKSKCVAHECRRPKCTTYHKVWPITIIIRQILVFRVVRTFSIACVRVTVSSFGRSGNDRFGGGSDRKSYCLISCQRPKDYEGENPWYSVARNRRKTGERQKRWRTDHSADECLLVATKELDNSCKKLLGAHLQCPALLSGRHSLHMHADTRCASEANWMSCR